MQLTAKILAFYLFLGSFFPRMDFSQLTKIPGMITHYQLHIEEAKLLGTTYDIWQFMNDHFINPDGHTHQVSDNPHENLPFNSIHSVIHFILEQFQIPEFSFSPNFFSTFSFSIGAYMTGFLDAVFHPPSLFK